MPKIYKQGKVVIVLHGRHAGKKAVVIQAKEDGTKEKKYSHAIVAGIERYPGRITRSMGAKRVARRSKVKPFVKTYNLRHLLPTRYALEMDNLKGVVSAETFKEQTQKEEAKKAIKASFEERFASGKNRWFFTKLQF